MRGSIGLTREVVNGDAAISDVLADVDSPLLMAPRFVDGFRQPVRFGGCSSCLFCRSSRSAGS